MKRKTKGWSDERRARQAQICRQTKPERFATGPKTAEGKAASSQNALKHGLRSAEVLKLRKLLRLHASQIKNLVDGFDRPLPKD